MLASQDVTLELVVLDDGSTDATPAILAAIPDPRCASSKAARYRPAGPASSTLATPRRHARHELMVFVDADVRLAPDALSRMIGFMQRQDIGLASGFPARSPAPGPSSFCCR